MREKERAGLRSTDLKKLKLGRYPWKAGVKYYIASREPYLSTSTIVENERKLKMIGDILTDLKAKGVVMTTDPRSVTPEDMESLLLAMKKNNLEVSTREKYISISNSYLKFFGNASIEILRSEQGRLLPPKPRKKIRALTINELKVVFKALAEIEGERGYVLRGMTALAFSTGARPKEVINSSVEDLDLKRNRFYIRHPKGEESWAIPQWVPIIRGDMLPILNGYTRHRSNQEGSYLFQNPDTGKPYSGNTIGRWYREVSDIVGFSIRLKDMRSTLASLTIEGDLSRLKAVSLQLRHSGISTTEKFYARINDGEIENEIGDVWRNNAID